MHSYLPWGNSAFQLSVYGCACVLWVGLTLAGQSEHWIPLIMMKSHRNCIWYWLYATVKSGDYLSRWIRV